MSKTAVMTEIDMMAEMGCAALNTALRIGALADAQLHQAVSCAMARATAYNQCAGMLARELGLANLVGERVSFVPLKDAA